MKARSTLTTLSAATVLVFASSCTGVQTSFTTGYDPWWDYNYYSGSYYGPGYIPAPPPPPAYLPAPPPPPPPHAPLPPDQRPPSTRPDNNVPVQPPTGVVRPGEQRPGNNPGASGTRARRGRH